MLAYHGYSETDGRITIIGNKRLPTGQRVVVTVLDDIAIDEYVNNKRAQKQRKAFEDFISAIDIIDNEPLGDEFDEILSHKFNIARELDL